MFSLFRVLKLVSKTIHEAIFLSRFGSAFKNNLIAYLAIPIIAFLAFPPYVHATFPVTASNINQGAVLPQSPNWPFPQFKEYPYGKSLATNNPDGVPHAEMEKTVIQMYVEAMHRLQSQAGWKPAGLPTRLLFVGGPTCSEGLGYGLLMSAVMVDKDSFDGQWINIHSWIPGVPSYETAGAPIQFPAYAGTCKTPGLCGVYGPGQDPATDGDEDIMMALLIAWKQWGNYSGYNTASGAPINYGDEFLRYASAFADWQQNPNAYPAGSTYQSALIGIDGYLKPCNTTAELTTWANATHGSYPPHEPSCAANGVGNCPGVCTSYLAPGYYRCFSQVITDAGGDTLAASQFMRAACSSDYLIAQMNAQRAPLSIGTNGISVNTAGVVSLTDVTWSNSPAEGIRTPYRTGLTYLWYGTPATYWDPVNMTVIAGTDTAEQNFVNAFSSFMYDPRTVGNPPFTAPNGLSYWGVPQILTDFTTTGLMTNYHIPTVLGPTSVAVCGSNAMAAAQQSELMKELYREDFLVWDKDGTGSDGSGIPQPEYFHSFFRWLGETTLTGNFHSPCEMVAQPNLKVYKSVDKTFAYAGDTLTYVLSYRNYGAADGNPVSIVDQLPADLFYVSSPNSPSSAPAVGTNGTVVWNLGTVPGLHNTSGGGTNLASTQGAVTLIVSVNPAAPNERICNTSQIFVGNSLQWTSNEYPNEASMIFKRNCVDIASRALTITKSANPTTVQPNNPVTFTVVATNQSGPGFWINGGRPKVYPGFGAAINTGGINGPMMFYTQLRSEAYEPLINPCNYRWSFFFYDPTYGTPGGAIAQQVYWLDATHNPNTFGTNANRTFTDFQVPQIPTYGGVNDSMTELPVMPGSDANGAWNQRYVVRWFDTQCPNPQMPNLIYGTTAGITNFEYNQKYGANTGLNDQYGDMVSLDPTLTFYVNPPANLNDPTNLWANGGANKAWSWMGAGYTPVAINGGTYPYPLPVSPDWTAGDGTSVPVTTYDPYGTQTSAIQYTQVLVEEWDGYTWRRIFGNGPVPGRDIPNVSVTDVIPSAFTWGGFVGTAPAGTTFNSPNLTVQIPDMLTGSAVTLTYWVTAKTQSSYPWPVTNMASIQSPTDSSKSASAAVTIVSTVGVTPTFTKTNTSTATLTPSNTPTLTPTLTATQTPSRTSTQTPSPTYSSTATQTPTLTPTSTVTPTLTLTRTATATNTSTPTPTVTMTSTLTATSTPTFTMTLTRTSTPTNTNTVTPTVSATNTATATNSLTLTWTFTKTSTSTLTYTLTPTPTLTVTSTNTTSVTSTSTPTRTLTVTPTTTPTSTSTLSITPTKTSTVTSTSTLTSTSTISPTVTVTGTPTQTFIYTPTITLTPTVTLSVTSTATSTPTYTSTMTNTLTNTVTTTLTYTQTPTPTLTPTWTLTNTATPTSTVTITRTQTPTATQTLTMTWTVTPTPTPQITWTPTNTFQFSATVTLTPTVTLTVTSTATPTRTYTSTMTNTSTNTLTTTQTYTQTPTPTLTLTWTLTNTSTPTLTNTETPTPTLTMTWTVTPTTTPPMTWTPTETFQFSPTVTKTATETLTVTDTSTLTVTPTQTSTPTETLTWTWTSTPTESLTSTETFTSTPSRTPSLTPTATPSATATASFTSTKTFTSTPTRTWTSTPTSSFTSTPTWTATPTASETSTATPVYTGTPQPSETQTMTLTPFPSGFFVDQNLFHGPQESVSIHVAVNTYPGEYSLKVYNTAGEVVKQWPSHSTPYKWVYPWDGRNDNGEMCASGVYIIYLLEPFDRKFAKVVLIH